MNTSSLLTSIRQIAITVSNLEQAKEFYKDKLGLPFLFEIPSALFFDCNGIRLMLGLPEAEKKEWFSSIIYFSVEDIHKAHQDLSAKAVVFAEEPHLLARMPDHDLWLAVFRDPDNNALALMSEVRRTA
jgi:methylmalonyl-CoA/ethylmalonyl-CoA epimerase